MATRNTAEVQHNVEKHHPGEYRDLESRVHPWVGHQRPGRRVHHESAADQGKGDEAASEARDESRSVDLGNVPHPGHGLLDGLRDPLGAIEQPDETDGETDPAALQAARRFCRIELSSDDRELVERRYESGAPTTPHR